MRLSYPADALAPDLKGREIVVLIELLDGHAWKKGHKVLQLSTTTSHPLPAMLDWLQANKKKPLIDIRAPKNRKLSNEIIQDLNPAVLGHPYEEEVLLNGVTQLRLTKRTHRISFYFNK